MLGNAAIMNINHHLCSTVLLLSCVTAVITLSFIIPFWGMSILSLNSELVKSERTVID